MQILRSCCIPTKSDSLGKAVTISVFLVLTFYILDDSFCLLKSENH